MQQILNNLPVGVAYIGPAGGLTEENIIRHANKKTTGEDKFKLKDDHLFGENI